MFFGPHVNRSQLIDHNNDIIQHIEDAREYSHNESGMDISAVAIFVGGPRTRKITLLADERVALKSYIERSNIQVIAHSSYSAQPWRGDPDAARYICEELNVCQESGIIGLVVHLPKLPIANIMKYISRLLVLNAPDVKIYLETPAVNPKESYYETPKKLTKLFKEIRKIDPNLERFGLCIDTAHLWTSGVDISTLENAENWIKELEANSDIIPHNNVMIHLNDSERPLGVGPDKHAGLAMGKIWSSYKSAPAKSGIAAFIDYALRHQLITILERKPQEALKSDYLILRKLIF